MARIGLVVPEYNEKSRSDLEGRLEFFSEIAARTNGLVDVVVVDDASKDGSAEALRQYVAANNPQFTALFMEKNGQKVGAIRKGVEAFLPNVEYVVLSDFDSSIQPQSLDALLEVIADLDANPQLAGYALKVVPDDSTSILNEFQRVDYAMGRGFHKFIAKEQKTRCIAGAGGVWRRSVLEQIFPKHSGRHNGDDMELTALAMKAGFRIKYAPNVVIKTQTPKDYFTLRRQRIRWEKGALETFAKEWKFYAKQVAKVPRLSRFGIATAWELANWALLPAGAYFAAQAVENRDAMYMARYYAFDLAFTAASMAYVWNEIEHKKKAIAMLPLMPVLRAAVQLPAKFSAGKSFLGDVAGDAALKAYAAYLNASDYVGEKINAVEHKAATVAKHAAATAVMASSMFQR